MSLVESIESARDWLRTPRYLRTRLMMETRPLNRMEMEIVFLEVSGGAALLRFPLTFMILPKSPRPWLAQKKPNDHSPI